MRGNELVEGVLKEWENIVNRVARDTVGEKVIFCGRSVRWWDDEIKAKIEQRCQLYKRMVRGQEGLWDEYNKFPHDSYMGKQPINCVVRLSISNGEKVTYL